MKISELDKILKDVRDRKIRTMEARVKILELIENLEVNEAVDLVKKLTLAEVIGQSEQCCEPLPKDSFYLGMTCPKCNKPFKIHECE